MTSLTQRNWCVHQGDPDRHSGNTTAATYRRGFAIGGLHALLRAKRRLPVHHHPMLTHLAVQYLKADNVITLRGIVHD
jgi:hypothetical protein